jgi:hypothetical protein
MPRFVLALMFLPSFAFAAGPVDVGAKGVIKDVGASDAYFPEKAALVGQKCTVLGVSPLYVADDLFSGSMHCEDGQDYAFLQVDFEADAVPPAPEKIGKGRQFRVANVHPDDAAAAAKDAITGRTCISTSALKPVDGNWYKGKGHCSDGSDRVFTKWMVEPLGQAPDPKATPKDIPKVLEKAGLSKEDQKALVTKAKDEVGGRLGDLLADSALPSSLTDALRKMAGKSGVKIPDEFGRDGERTARTKDEPNPTSTVLTTDNPVLEFTAGQKDLSLYAKALANSGFKGRYLNQSATYFAPTDAALKQATPDIEAKLASPDYCKQLIGQSMVFGRYDSAKLGFTEPVAWLDGTRATVANVKLSKRVDIRAGDAVIHVIDAWPAK